MPEVTTDPDSSAMPVLAYDSPIAGPIARNDDPSLRIVVTSLWTLGGLYLSGGGLLASYLLAYRGLHWGVGEAAALIPGILFLLLASSVHRQRKWAIRATLFCNLLAMLAWLAALFLVVKYLGWIDLIQLRQIPGDAVALLILLLLAYHARTLWRLQLLHAGRIEYCRLRD